MSKEQADRLREDIAAVRAAFDKSHAEFQGAFDMRDWIMVNDGKLGEMEDPERLKAAAERHWCGTVCCLGGWMQLLGTSGWTGVTLVHGQYPRNAGNHYGMTTDEVDALFFQWDDERDLEGKLAEAEKIADAIEARS